MRDTLRQLAMWLVGGILLVSGGGCAVGLDFVNPALLERFGIDTQSIFGPRGSVVVSFRNETNFPVTFSGISGVDVADLTRGVDVFTAAADPNAARNEVLRCDVGFITFGDVSDEFALDPTVAVRVVTPADEDTGEGEAPVPYAGSALVFGVDFFCGDVIDFRVSGDLGAFQITVRVIPGR